MKRLVLATALWVLLPQAAALAAEAGNGEEEDFDPSHEFEQHEWIPIHIGPLDMSITKAVAYLILGAVVTMLIGILLIAIAAPYEP